MNSHLARPLPRALLAQLLALILMAVLVWQLAGHNLRLPLLTAAIGQGALAALFAWRFKLSRWWLWISFFFVPMAVLALQTQLPAWLYLLAFSLLALININGWREQVPLYLSGRRACEQLKTWLAQHEEIKHVIDLGCGTAGPLLQLAAHFPRRQFVGVETAPLLFAFAWLRCAFQPNCQIHFQSLWKAELSRFDAVYCFLSPAPMPALWDKVQKQMRPDTWLISNTFAVPEQPATHSLPIHQGRQTVLHLWQIKATDIR